VRTPAVERPVHDGHAVDGVTTYPVIGPVPLYEGAVHDSETVPSGLPVALTDVGACGPSYGVMMISGSDPVGASPTVTLVAVDTVQLDPPAPLAPAPGPPWPPMYPPPPPPAPKLQTWLGWSCDGKHSPLGP